MTTLNVSHFNHLLDLRHGGQVMRYHTTRVNRRENNAEHSHGVAIIALAFWPDVSCRLLTACLIHDLQEGRVGDMPHTVKRDFPALNDVLVDAERAAAEALGLHHVMGALTDAERERLKVADVVDAWHYGYDEYRLGNVQGATIMNNAMIAIVRYPNAGVPFWWKHAAQDVMTTMGGAR